MYIGAERMVVRRAELAGLSRVKKVAPATWPATYAGIIPDEVQRRLLDTRYSRERSSRDLVAPGGKKRVLRRLFSETPSHVRFVAVDFRRDDLRDGLPRAGYRDSARTFIL